MSASAMSALLKDVKETGMPEAHGRKDIRASRTAAIQLASGPFGSLIQPVEVFDKKGKPMVLDIISPLVFVTHAFGQPGSFHEFMLDSPWQLLLYSDEVTPVNVLGEARRKR